MNLIEFKNVSRVYKNEDGEDVNALNSVSLSFPNKGLIAVLGKSGSGKSTIINLIGKLDEPTSGAIIVNDKDIRHYKKKRLEKYHNEDIGIVFQHYHLLEEHTVLYNVMLPALIKGIKENKAKRMAIELLREINFKESLYKSKCANLSGGEKERVAIARALINNPSIILADEPTGALDSANSVAVMEILKKISKTKLVILVSHNLSLTYAYADKIFYLKDGRLEKEEVINKEEDEPLKEERKATIKYKKLWSNPIIFKNFRKRIVRNLISIISLSIGLIASLLIIGFSNGSGPSITNDSYEQFDYGAATVYKEFSKNISGSKMSLVQQLRPSLPELNSINKTLSHYYLENNFDALLPAFCSIKIGEEKLEEFSYKPIYSFLDKTIDKSLLTKGYIPAIDNLYEAVINEKAYNYLKKKTGGEVLGTSIDISSNKEFHYYTGEQVNPSISDVFSYQRTIFIVGVVKEMDFLATPKIYYPYTAFIEYLQNYPINNLSVYLNRNISWYERVTEVNNNDELSSYSYRLFLKDIKDKTIIEKDIKNTAKPLVIYSNAYTLGTTLLDLINAATMGMGIFLIISLIGTGLIVGIVSFSSYSEDKKNIAILSCLGANRSDVMDIYVLENIIIAVIALVLSFIFSPMLEKVANAIIYKTMGFSNMVVIPFMRYMGLPLLLVLIIIVATLFIATLSTVLPITFSNKISLKKELTDE
ncbi:MAG: ATP-binding cassette domain-containing protein [Bacilli bacterium]|nr:ATP-binding cassette domain-containing protein [Bacilli bacterium]